MEHDQQQPETKPARRRYRPSQNQSAEPVVEPVAASVPPIPAPPTRTERRRRDNTTIQPAAAVPTELPQQHIAPEPPFADKSMPAQEAPLRSVAPANPAEVPAASADLPDASKPAARPDHTPPTNASVKESSDASYEKRTSESYDMRFRKQPQAVKPIEKETAAASKPQTEKTPADRQTEFKYSSQYTAQKHKQGAGVKKETSPKSNKTDKSAATPPPSGEKPPLKKRLPYYIGIALCSIVLIVSGTLLVRYYSRIWRANQATSQLRDLYMESSPTAGSEIEPSADNKTISGGLSTQTVAATATPVPTQPQIISSSDSLSAFKNAWPKRYPGNEGMVIQPRFEPLRHENRDIVGWLRIEGVVDEPVFQRDNSYYLTHDATGTSNPTGALFLDENCNLRTVPMMSLIHGHNMKEGAMFGSLKKYKVKDASFYREHPFVTFDTLYETATYVIFSVAEVNIVPGNTHYFPFWHQFHFDTQQSFDSFVLLAKEYSRFKVDIDVRPGDRLLTLATCSSEDDNLRLIVMARMLREDEDKIMLTNKIYSAVSK